MITTAIISEFNPLHNGHKYLIEEARRKTKCDILLTIMSGNFVQRGDLAILEKYQRAEVCIEEGFDMVIEMPNFISLQSAQYFARKNIDILNKINPEFLVFGIENLSATEFFNQCKKIIKEENVINRTLKIYQKQGLSYKTAMEKALKKIVSENFYTSNNILALEYVKSLCITKSNIRPVAIVRKKSFNRDRTFNDSKFASSSAIRNNITDKNLNYYLPKSSYESLMANISSINTLDNYFQTFKYLCLIEKKPFFNIIGYHKSFDKTIIDALVDSDNFTYFFKNMKSRNITENRVRRFILNYLLNATNDLNKIDINFFHVLTFNQNALKLLKANSKAFIINKKDSMSLTKTDKKIYNNMINATNFYHLYTDKILNYDYKKFKTITKSKKA